LLASRADVADDPLDDGGAGLRADYQPLRGNGCPAIHLGHSGHPP
jgi:hypothetical protein